MKGGAKSGFPRVDFNSNNDVRDLDDSTTILLAWLIRFRRFGEIRGVDIRASQNHHTRGTRVRPFGPNSPYRNSDFHSLDVSCFLTQLVLLFFSNRDPYRQRPNVRDRGERRDQNHVGTGSVRFSSLVEKLTRILPWITLLCLSNGPLKSFIVSRLAAYFLYKRRGVDNRWNSSRTVSPFEIVFSCPSWKSWIFQLGQKKGSVIWLWRKRFV